MTSDQRIRTRVRHEVSDTSDSVQGVQADITIGNFDNIAIVADSVRLSVTQSIFEVTESKRMYVEGSSISC